MKLLKELCEASGAPGFEDRIRDIFRRELTSVADRIETDGIGNIIAVREADDPNAPKVMLAGHLDEIGFVVKYVSDDGFLRISPLGGFDPKTLIAKRVRVCAQGGDLEGVIGTKPIHLMSEAERKKLPTLDGLFVDLGLPGERVKALVQVGDPVTLVQDFHEMGDLLCGKSMDNRVSIYTLIEVMRRLETRKVTVYAVGTAQEEIGVRGALTAAHRLKPHMGVAVDVTMACDVIGAKPEEYVSEIGKGVAIKILDSWSISNPKLVKRMRALAEANDIPYQLEVLPRGGTDAGGIQRGGDPVPVITLSVPTRYVHSVVETISARDLEGTVDLLTAFVESAHEADLSY